MAICGLMKLPYNKEAIKVRLVPQIMKYNTIAYLGLGFSGQNYHPKTSLTIPSPGALAVLVRYKQVQKCLQYNLKHFQKVATKLISFISVVEFSTVD